MSKSARPSTSFDVIVVGGGLAGHSAALTAAESGASVCLLEKGEDFGGSSVKAGGGMLFAGTDLQAEAGVEDDNEKLRQSILKAGQGKSDSETVEVYLRHQLDTYEWTRDLGVEWTLVLTGTSDVSRMHAAPQGYLTRFLHDKFVARDNTEYRANAAATRLVRDDSGRVSGVVALIDGDEVTIAADESVILASGGFANSRELLEIFAPKWADAVKMGGIQNTGDGLRMAWALGAQVADMAYIEASFGASLKHYPELSQDPAEEPRLLYPNSQGAAIVNLDGTRFVNEALNYKIISSTCAKQPKGIGFQIFDDGMMARSNPAPTPADFKSALADGYVIQADTLAELAEKLEIDPATFEATIDAYNGYVDAGSDPDFGRTIQNYGTVGGGRIDSAPFYAFACTSGLTTTYCGLKVNGRLQVIDVFGQPIEGLYAAGEVVGGFHGATYLSGTGLGKAGVFGRAAGKESVATTRSAN
jgi:fumarate reductase flavoprotein subunit